MPNQELLPISNKDTGRKNIRPATPHIKRQDGVEAYTFLRKHNTFAKVPEKELKQLAAACRFASIDAGEYITSEGYEKSLYGFIVVSGRLAMNKTSLSGKELVVELLAPGDIFGLLLTLAHEDAPSELSARAQSKSEVLWVPIQELDSVLNSHPSLYKEFLIHLLEYLQSSYKISRGLAHDRVQVRIAAVLSTLARKFSRPLPAVQDNTIDITRQQLADLTGTTPETAIRVTRSMQRAGMIDMKHPGIIRILNQSAHQELAEH